MARSEDMEYIANSCPGYNAVDSSFQSSIGTEQSKSCQNCEHFKNEKCNTNLYDKVLSSLDQT